jgi:glucosyl-3-phosphoglycerate synthase
VKGEALWKSLLVAAATSWPGRQRHLSIARFVRAARPLLDADPVGQGFRPGATSSGTASRRQAAGATELTASRCSIVSELSGLIQPLAAVCRPADRASTSAVLSGYGVETGLLIDMVERFGLGSIAQVDLLERVHRNQELTALSKMSFAIIQVVMRRVERRAGSAILEGVNTSMKIIRRNAGGYYLDVEHVAEDDRPPMIAVEQYLRSRGPKAGPGSG